MEKYSQYLMWMKNKHHHQILNSSRVQAASSMNTWQEQAFAEDALGPLGGFAWPPRSYSCTFCKREFRSAQALGGHMNVHRRDRARLKQSLSPQTDDTITQFPPQVCTSDHSNPSNFAASPPPRENFSKQTDVSIFSSYPITSKARQIGLSYSSDPLDSKMLAWKNNIRNEDQSMFRGRNDGNYVETSLSVGLNCGVSSNRSAGDIDSDRCKRRKIDDFPLPFLLKGCSNGKEIDLELRLGDSATVGVPNL